jgi:hypothetical protein
MNLEESNRTRSAAVRTVPRTRDAVRRPPCRALTLTNVAVRYSRSRMQASRHASLLQHRSPVAPVPLPARSNAAATSVSRKRPAAADPRDARRSVQLHSGRVQSNAMKPRVEVLSAGAVRSQQRFGAVLAAEGASAAAADATAGKNTVLLQCFYCRKHIDNIEKFIVCGVCYGLVSCQRCWESKVPGVGSKRRSVVWLDERKEELLIEDGDRDPRRRLWNHLRKHTFNPEHADWTKVDPDFNLTSWGEYSAACESDADDSDADASNSDEAASTASEEREKAHVFKRRIVHKPNLDDEE